MYVKNKKNNDMFSKMNTQESLDIILYWGKYNMKNVYYLIKYNAPVNRIACWFNN